MSYLALVLGVTGLTLAGLALLWAHQTRYPSMFAAVAVILFIAAEFVIGWWALPVVGFILGLVGARRKAVGAIVAGAALTAWVALYAWSAMRGHNLPGFMESLAASMKVKPGQLFSAISALPALLAGPAARFGAGLRPETAAKQPAGAAFNG
jgi:hypothetical protein